MAWLIGTDEAGFGPNLGPLTVAATVWHVPDTSYESDLYDVLADAVVRQPARSERRLAIADSKQLYKPGGGVRLLEHGVFASLATLGCFPADWNKVWAVLAPDSEVERRELPWYQSFDASVPLDGDRAEIERFAGLLRDAFGGGGVSLEAVQVAAVFPAEFNRRVDELDSKGALLSDVTLGLIERMLVGCDSGPILIHCDKHGGRNKYGPMLQTRFPEYLIEPQIESRQRSVYQFGPRDRRLEIRFVAKGERFLPSALASMAAKYVRELAMRAFNDFWCTQLGSLKPTAGYPQDAKRFRMDVAEKQHELGIADTIFWRKR